LKAWINTEKKIAEILGMTRTHKVMYQSVPDVYDDNFVVECKERKTFPQLIAKSFEQAMEYVEALKKEDGKSRDIIVALHPLNTRKYYVIMEAEVFAKYYVPSKKTTK